MDVDLFGCLGTLCRGTRGSQIKIKVILYPRMKLRNLPDPNGYKYLISKLKFEY